MKFLFVEESAYMHKPRFHHPENPGRVLRIREAATSVGIVLTSVSIKEADVAEGLRVAYRVHAKGYIDYLVRLSQKAPAMIDEDTYLTEDSLELALATLHFSYRYAGEEKVVFLVSRPPGHHAGKGGKALGVRTQGFCLLNNAVAAVQGFRDKGLKRLAILDFDAHHGNGTMEILYRERVLQVDIHQDPDTLYPHTGYPEEIGEGEGYGFKVNLIMPPSSGDDLLLELSGRIFDLLREYSPEALVVSAGFDAFEGDGLADLRLTEISYYNLGRIVKELEVPTMVVLEGGYDVGLQRGVTAFVNGLLGAECNYEYKSHTPQQLYREAVEVANRVLEKARRRWS